MPAAKGAATVVVKLPWGQIWHVVKTVIDLASTAITVYGLVDGIQKEYTASLSENELASIKKGGNLILEGADGKQVNGNSTLSIHTPTNQDLELNQWRQTVNA